MSSQRTNGDYKRRGFSLPELLIVVAIIAVLSGIILYFILGSREKAYYSRLKLEFRSFETAMMHYLIDFGEYPPDVSRDIPAGLEEYLASDGWPDGPYPGSVYDWDNITGNDPYVQLSLRFCDIKGENCYFPNEEWAEDFDYQSSAYHCFQGDCRSHPNQPVDHPGHCVNCTGEEESPPNNNGNGGGNGKKK